jgi:hypothetical protein
MVAIGRALDQALGRTEPGDRIKLLKSMTDDEISDVVHSECIAAYEQNDDLSFLEAAPDNLLLFFEELGLTGTDAEEEEAEETQEEEPGETEAEAEEPEEIAAEQDDEPMEEPVEEAEGEPEEIAPPKRSPGRPRKAAPEQKPQVKAEQDIEETQPVPQDQPPAVSAYLSFDPKNQTESLQECVVVLAGFLDGIAHLLANGAVEVQAAVPTKAAAAAPTKTLPAKTQKAVELECEITENIFREYLQPKNRLGSQSAREEFMREKGIRVMPEMSMKAMAFAILKWAKENTAAKTEKAVAAHTKKFKH